MVINSLTFVHQAHITNCNFDVWQTLSKSTRWIDFYLQQYSQYNHYCYACMANLFLLGWYIVQLQSNPVQVHNISFLLIIGNTCVFHILYHYNINCSIWQLPLSYCTSLWRHNVGIFQLHVFLHSLYTPYLYHYNQNSIICV